MRGLWLFAVRRSEPQPVTRYERLTATATLAGRGEAIANFAIVPEGKPQILTTIARSEIRLLLFLVRQ